MTKFIFLIFLFILSPYLQADEKIIVQAPQTPKEEFLAYIDTENLISYSEFQLKQIQKQEKPLQELLILLEQAQKSFLKDHLSQAGEYFRLITKKAFDENWTKEARNIIFYSFLRLAQIEWKDPSAEVFLHSAVIFDLSLEPKPELFHPPLIQKFDRIKKNLPKIKLSLSRIFPFHSSILINGRVFSSKENIELPYGKYFVTALSSSHKAWHRILNISQLVQKRVTTSPIVRGHCSQAIFSKKMKKRQTLFPNFCLWQPSIDPKKDEGNEKSLSAIEKNVLATPHNFQWKPYIKWGVLAGVGAFAVYLIASSANKPKKQEEAKHTPIIKKGF